MELSLEMRRPVLLRKLSTLSKTIARCRSWPAIVGARLGLLHRLFTVHFRDGLKLSPLYPLSTNFGEIFDPAIADLYGIGRQKTDFIVDVGGNIGGFACFAARSHPNAQVHAFEPSTPQADQFLKNVGLNGLTNVTLHRQAVTRDGRRVKFQVHGTGQASGIILPSDREIELPSVSLSTLDFSGSRRLFIKLDCEGAEGEILEWICNHRTRLPRSVYIACEYHLWTPIPLADSVTLLEQHGFGVTTPLLYDEQYLFASSGWEE